MSCGCICEVCGIERETLEEMYPLIFYKGPTEEMYAQWDLTWGPRRIPWAGEMNGLAECREFGFWSLWDGREWTTVPAGTPDALEDRNQLFGKCIWNADEQRWHQSK